MTATTWENSQKTNKDTDMNWEHVYEQTNVDSEYDTFLRIFMSLYNKNCPIINGSREQRYTDQPWMTKGFIKFM